MCPSRGPQPFDGGAAASVALAASPITLSILGMQDPASDRPGAPFSGCSRAGRTPAPKMGARAFRAPCRDMGVRGSARQVRNRTSSSRDWRSARLRSVMFSAIPVGPSTDRTRGVQVISRRSGPSLRVVSPLTAASNARLRGTRISIRASPPPPAARIRDAHLQRNYRAHRPLHWTAAWFTRDPERVALVRPHRQRVAREQHADCSTGPPQPACAG